MNIIFSDKPMVKDNNSIFLAGPTKRNNFFVDSWRKTACDYLESVGYDGTVYVPEFEASKAPINLTAQSMWEREGLVNAGCIVFYVCRNFPEMPGLTTNIEFGTYIVRKPWNCLLCCPENANKNSYLEWLYKTEKPEDVIYRTLEDVLDAAVNKAHEYAKLKDEPEIFLGLV